MAVNQRLRLLHLARILREETDSERGLTMPQILGRLEEAGCPAERKAVYRDLEALRSFGLDVGALRAKPVQYALLSRDFTLAELRLLMDAVQGSRFLTQSMSDSLSQGVRRLASAGQRELLDKRLHVAGRVKLQSESVLPNVDAIQEAMARHRKVSFRYYRYDEAKRKVMRRGGERYVETPVELVYSDGYYYLVAYNEKHDGFPAYRVDRMAALKVTDEAACRNARIASFDVGELVERAFGMYGGESVLATLLVERQAMDGVIDRFGRGVESVPTGDGKARVYVPVVESPAFFGWVSQFGGRVLIEGPASLAESYRRYLRAILDAYE